MASSILAWIEPHLRSLLRLVAAFTFSLHGVQKLFGWLGGRPAAAFTLPWTAGVLETFGGLLLLVGLGTRPVAFLLCGEMAVAYFMSHAPRGLWPVRNGGELAVLYCFLFLYLWAAGPGPWSLDRLVRKGSA